MNYSVSFGKHVRSLRRARGWTQDDLSARSGISADTIRRIERGTVSTTVDTLRKVCDGLGVAPSTMFEAFELGRTSRHRELLDLLGSRSERELEFVARIVRSVLDELDGLKADP